MSASQEVASPTPPALTELSGTVLEQRYQLGRVLGTGGMGAVFEARHLKLDRPVAIKVLRPMFAAEGEYIERFLREAKSASKIRHRNVVEILDYGEAAGGLLYSVMEYLVGQDLEQLLSVQPDKRLPWSRACSLLMQIASGLKAAHGQKVIHRDIKPANCFLTDEDGEPVVKLVDFGIAKLEDGGRGHTLTGTAQVLGTPSYIAPELVRTQSPASPRSDIYALGVVAYRMLAGRVPFSAGTVFEVLRRACFDPVPSLREHVPDLPLAVENFVLELLAKEPERRPVDMLAVRQRLLELSQETIGPLAVEIPVSKALPLGIDDSLPPGSTEDATVPRETAGGNTIRSQPQEVGLTAVMVEPLLKGFEPRLSPPPDASPAIIVSPADAPQASARASTSLPSPKGERVSSVGESTMPSMPSGSSDRPNRHDRRLWLGLGGAGLLAGILVFVVPAVMDAGETVKSVTAKEALSPIEPSSDLAATMTSKPSEVESSTSPSFLAAASFGSIAGGEELSTGGSSAMGAVDSGEDKAIILFPEDERTDEPDLASGPPSDGSASIDAPTPPRKPAKSKPAGPPADSVLFKKLKRTIIKRCADALGDGSVTVKFMVTKAGGVMGATVTPPGSAGTCAKAQVQGMKFRPRLENEALRITVE